MSCWWYKLAAVSCVVLLQSVNASETTLDPALEGFQQFNGLYEPSGVIQLPDRRLLIVEDEPARSFMLLAPKTGSTLYEVDILRARSPIAALLAGPSSGKLSDLEALVQGPDDVIYAITSHSRQGNGRRDRDREKLVRLTVDGKRIGDISTRTDLREALLTTFPILKESAKERDVKDDVGLNIEGLAFSKNLESLWIGFRGPLLDDKAILIAIDNPAEVFAGDTDFEFAEDVQLLDLDGGGIRDIVFDTKLDGYLIVSQREGTKSEKSFKLWFWKGTPDASPRRVKIDGVKDLRRTEGIASVSIGQGVWLLLVSDEGDAVKGKSAEYLLVPYDELEIE